MNRKQNQKEQQRDQPYRNPEALHKPKSSAPEGSSDGNPHPLQQGDSTWKSVSSIAKLSQRSGWRIVLRRYCKVVLVLFTPVHYIHLYTGKDLSRKKRIAFQEILFIRLKVLCGFSGLPSASFEIFHRKASDQNPDNYSCAHVKTPGSACLSLGLDSPSPSSQA